MPPIATRLQEWSLKSKRRRSFSISRPLSPPKTKQPVRGDQSRRQRGLWGDGPCAAGTVAMGLCSHLSPWQQRCACCDRHRQTRHSQAASPTRDPGAPPRPVARGTGPLLQCGREVVSAREEGTRLGLQTPDCQPRTTGVPVRAGIGAREATSRAGRCAAGAGAGAGAAVPC